MSDKFVIVRAHAQIDQLNVIMEPEVDTPLNVGHRAALTIHNSGYIKEELPTDVDILKVFKAKGSGHIMVSMPEDLKLPYNQFANSNVLAGLCSLVSLHLSNNKIVIISKEGLRNISSLQPLSLARNKLSTGKDTVIQGEVLDVVNSDYVSHTDKLKENFGDFVTMVRDKFIPLSFKHDTGLIVAVYDRGINVHRYEGIAAMLDELLEFAQASSCLVIDQLQKCAKV